MMVTRTDGDEIYAPDKELMDKISPQIDHATWHGWKWVEWRVGVNALDRWAPDHKTENVTMIMGCEVVRDLLMPRYAIRLVAE